MHLLMLFCLLLGSLLGQEPDERLLSGERGAVLPKGEVFSGDYFACRESIEIEGTVEGDAYLVGTQIIIDGTIRGDLIALGGSVEVLGKVQGSVKVLAGQVLISGSIGKNSLIAAADAQFMQGAHLAGNLTLLSGHADVESMVEGNVSALSSSLRLAGMLEKNVKVYVGSLRVASKTRIGENLTYRSHETAFIDPQAQIQGSILYEPSLFKEFLDLPLLRGVIIGSKVAAFLMNFFYTFVIGVLLIRMFPKRLSKALYALRLHPAISFFYGLVLLILIPLASILLLITVIGAPFALTLIALNILSLYTMKVFFILGCTNLVFSKIGWKQSTLKALILGQLVYSLVTLIPGIGLFVSFCATLLGLGAAASSEEKLRFFR